MSKTLHTSYFLSCLSLYACCSCSCSYPCSCTCSGSDACSFACSCACSCSCPCSRSCPSLLLLPHLSLLLPPDAYSWSSPPPISLSSCSPWFQVLFLVVFLRLFHLQSLPVVIQHVLFFLLLLCNPLLVLHLPRFLSSSSAASSCSASSPFPPPPLQSSSCSASPPPPPLLLFLVSDLSPPCRGQPRSKAGGPNPRGLHKPCSRPMAGSTSLGLSVAPQLPHHAVPGSQCACHGWLCTDQESGCLWPLGCRCASCLLPAPPFPRPNSSKACLGHALLIQYLILPLCVGRY